MTWSSALQLRFEQQRRIDQVLRGPFETLVDVGCFYAAKPRKDDPHKDICPDRLYFPPQLGASPDTEPAERYVLTRALCCATLERLWQYRRRFDWAKDHIKKLGDIRDRLVKTFVPSDPSNFSKCIECLRSRTFGTLNPLTASQVFRVLTYGGEDKAHSGIGFLAFFAIVSSLRRRSPDGRITGAGFEQWHPSAYITAKCLFPLKTLHSVCNRRANHFQNVAKSIEALEKLATEQSVLQHWKFAAELDKLSIQLSDLSVLAIDRKAFQDCAKEVEKSARSLDSFTKLQTVCIKVQEELVRAFKQAGAKSNNAHVEANSVIDEIRLSIVSKLNETGVQALVHLGMQVGAASSRDEEYWENWRSAAQDSLGICDLAICSLKEASEKCSEVAANAHSLGDLLGALAKANVDLAKAMYEVGRENARWCCSVVEREIAHASAGNFTDFDSAELVSGLAAAVRWHEMTNPQDISSAIENALKGVTGDGSWILGQPFHKHGRIMAAYPITSDVMWTLASVVKQHSEVEVADEIFGRYIDWLEKTLLEYRSFTGWASERARQPKVIDLWATSLATNALFEIRDIQEFRLWQICEKRFGVVPVTKPLEKVDPVDLGASHEHRLHHKLARMARDVEVDNEAKAHYSFIFHGPPGSSKTAMAQALAKEMWRSVTGGRHGGPRLIRITPADFTRRGEDRLDFEAHLIFDLLRHVRGVVVFFDEVDDLLRKRQQSGPFRFMDLVSPAMLNRFADLRQACPSQQICFIFGTNFIEQIEPALFRQGRIDEKIPVVYPDTESRHAIVQGTVEKLREKSADKAQQLQDLENDVVHASKFWPWMTLDELLREFGDEDTLTREGLERLLKEPRFKIERPPSGYLERVRPKSHELEGEILHYSFAGWSTLSEYEEELVDELKKWVLNEPEPNWYSTFKDRGVEIWRAEGRPLTVPKLVPGGEKPKAQEAA